MQGEVVPATQPSNVERLVVIVVMALGIPAAHLTWLFR
jgi:hypothetical protein